MTVYTSGYVFQDDGDALNGATVQLLQVSDGAEEASTTTNSSGFWSFNETDEDRYDVKITSGTSIRFRKWADEISLKMVDARNNEGAGIPAAVFTNLTNSTSNQVAIFRGANTTRADNDEIYLSFELADSGGALDEFARITAVATDVTAGSEDGALVFSVADTDSSGDLQEAFRISSSTGGTVSQTFTTDSVTFGTGGDEDVVINFNANTADGVLTWMEDEDYFKFSDDILMNSTERINFYDTGIYIYSSADGQLDLVADTEIQIAATTIDIDGAVAFNGALTGITNITLSGTLSDGNYTFDTSGNVSGLGTIGSGAITSTSTVQGTTITATTAFVPDASDGAALGTTSLEFSDLYLADGAVVGFGDDQDVTLTHVVDTGLLLSSTDRLQFGDAGTFIHQSADGVLTIESDTTVDINGAVALNGAITGATDITLSGELDAATLDLSSSADIAGDLVLSGGADGALQFSNAGENSIKIPDNQASALIIEEADNAYITFVTTNSSEAITIAKATTFSAGIADTGTIAAGTWNGTAIATSYIAGDAITGAKIADDAIDSEHYTDGSIDNAHIADDAIDSEHYAAASIDFAHIQNIAANSILGRDANSSGVLSEVALATTQILIGDGTGFTPAALSGDATMTNAGVVSLAAAQTNVTSLLATDIKIGEDDQTKIDFEDANTINFYANNAKEVVLAENSLSPGTSDGTALGTTSLMWSDLFVASGGVINFNNGDITVTHSSNTLTVAGGTLAAAAITGTTIDASTDFTIGDTVITDGVITDSSGLQLAAKVGIGVAASGSYITYIKGTEAGEGTALGQLAIQSSTAFGSTPDAGIIFINEHTSGSQAIMGGIKVTKSNTGDTDLDSTMTLQVRKHGAVAFDAITINEDSKATFAGDIVLDGDLGFTGPQEITTSSGNLTIGAATGAKVLIGDNDTILYVDGGHGGIGVGAAPNSQSYFHVAGSFTGAVSGPSVFTITTNLTTTAGTADQTPALARISGGIITAAEGSGTEYDVISTLSLKEPGITLGSNTTTAVAATLYIEDAPSEGVLDYALWVGAGASRFDGAVEFGQDGTNYDVTFYGDTSGRDMIWDAGLTGLLFKDNAAIRIGDSSDMMIYHDGTNNIIVSTGLSTGGGTSGVAASYASTFTINSSGTAEKIGLSIQSIIGDGANAAYDLTNTSLPGLSALSVQVGDHSGANAMTVNLAAGLRVRDATLPGDVVITSQHGIFIENQTGGGTNNVGINLENITGSNPIGIDMGENTLENVGASGNDWTSRELKLVSAGGDVKMTVENTDNSGDARLMLKGPASGGSDLIIQWLEGSGNGAANNMGYQLGYRGSNDYFALRSFNTDGSSTDADIWRIPDGQLSIDANTTWDENIFDDYDDVAVLSPYREGQFNLSQRKDDLIEMGVLKQYDDGFIGYNDQRMAALLAGGIYQNRERMDAQHEAMDARLKRIEQALGV